MPIDAPVATCKVSHQPFGEVIQVEWGIPHKRFESGKGSCWVQFPSFANMQGQA